MNKDYFGITDSLIKAVEEATKPHTVPKTDKDKKLAALAHPKDKITHKDVMVGRGVVAKEETELDESTPSSQQVKQAIGIARDKRYAKGNVTGAVKAMDKLNKGLAQHPAVKKELQKQNEATSAYARIDARFKKLSGRSMGAAAKEYGDEAKKLQKEIDAQQAENERRKAAMKTEETDTPGNSYEHQCAVHVKHAKLGEGRCLTTQHADTDEQGNIEWYDVMFEEGIARVPTVELEILVSESHMHSKRKKGKM